MGFLKRELTFIEHLLCAELYCERLCVLLTNPKSIPVNYMGYYPDFIGKAVETLKDKIACPGLFSE